jgi:hypothetical protein
MFRRPLLPTPPDSDLHTHAWMPLRLVMWEMLWWADLECVVAGVVEVVKFGRLKIIVGAELRLPRPTTLGSIGC